MWLIMCGWEYVRSIDPVSGRATWTRDVEQAQQFTLEDAERYAEGIGRAVPR